MRRRKETSIWNGFAPGMVVSNVRKHKEQINDKPVSDRKHDCPKCKKRYARSVTTIYDGDKVTVLEQCGWCGEPVVDQLTRDTLELAARCSQVPWPPKVKP